MSVKIRLSRTGRHNDACYRVVVADSRYAADGRCIEQLGFYNPAPCKDEKGLNINEEACVNWLLKGAQPSDSVRTLLIDNGIMDKFANAKKAK